jgi:hyperosmotically inducible periplasmic protein
MSRTFLAAAVIALAACSEPPPPPAPVAAPSVEPAKPEPKEQVKAPEAPKPDPNAELATRVKRALEGEAKVQAAAIDVTAADGKVTLWGTAASAGERSRAGQVAGKVEGVKAVDNQLKVVRGS